MGVRPEEDGPWLDLALLEHRLAGLRVLDVGLEPACVVVCPTQAILVGDMTDPLSKVNQIIS